MCRAIDSPGASYSPLFLRLRTHTRYARTPRHVYATLEGGVRRRLNHPLRYTPSTSSPRILIELSPLLMRLRSVSVESLASELQSSARQCVCVVRACDRTRGCVRDAPYLFTHTVEYITVTTIRRAEDSVSLREKKRV